MRAANGWLKLAKSNVVIVVHTRLKAHIVFGCFAFLACLAAVIVFKVVHVYLQDHQEMPVQQSLLDVLNQNNKSGR